MNIQKNKIINITILLIVALIQGPLSYYFTFGFIKLFFMLVFGIVGLLLTICFIIKLARDTQTNTLYHIFGLVVAVMISSLTLFSDRYLEYIDWRLRKNERNDIVEDVKKGIIKSGTLPGYYLIPISNGGNEINIIENNRGTISVGFYIDRGFLDHSTELIYTNNPNKIKEIEDQIASGKYPAVRKFDANWFKIVDTY